MKTLLKKIIICLSFLFCYANVVGQIWKDEGVSENRYVVNFTIMSPEYNLPSTSSLKQFGMVVNGQTYADNYKGEAKEGGMHGWLSSAAGMPSQLFIDNTKINYSSNMEWDEPKPVKFGSWTIRVDVGGPAIIKSALSNKLPFACPGEDITLTIDNQYQPKICRREYGYDYDEFGKHGPYTILCNGKVVYDVGYWEAEEDSITISYNRLVGAGVDPTQPLRFSTYKAFDYGGYSTSTCPTLFRYRPKLQLPSKLEIEPPKCQGDSTTIKIPYNKGIDYKFTVKSRATGQTLSYALKEHNVDKIIQTPTHYIITDYFQGQYTLTIESSPITATTPCPFDTTFMVSPPPNFTINNITYLDTITDNLGNTVQIKTTGGKGQVKFSIVNGGNRSATFYVGNEPFSTTLVNGVATINLPSGTYNDTYAVVDDCTTSNKVSVKLTQPQPITYDTIVYHPKCHNEKGSITISNIKGGIGTVTGNGYWYILDNSVAQSFNAEPLIIPDLSSKEHTITIQDNYGNKLQKTFTIDPVPSAVTITTTITPPSISDANDATVTLTASGGTPPYTYSTDDYNYQTDNFFSGFQSGGATIYVKDSNGCPFNVPITIPEGRKITVQSTVPTAPVCNGEKNGSCVITISNLAGTLSVSKLPDCSRSISGNVITLNDLEAGENYSFTVTETYKGFTYSIEPIFTIPVKPAISINATVTPVANKGTASGKIAVSVSGGNSGTYRVVLLDEQNNKIEEKSTVNNCSFENLAGSSENGGKLYKIQVYDSKNCTAESSEYILEPAIALKLTATLATPVSCNNDSDAAVSISATGGWGDYLYSINEQTWNTTNTFNNLPAGTYTYFVKDINNGTASAAIHVINPQALQIATQSITPAACYGTATGAIRFRVSGGTFPYEFVQKTGAVTTTFENNDTIMTVSGLVYGNYNVTLKDSHNCTQAGGQIFISQPAQLQIATSNIAQPTCGEANGSLTATATGGTAPYTYTLIQSGETNALQTLTSSSAVIFQNIASAQYTINVTDANGCAVQSAPVTFNQYVNPVIQSAVIDNATCFGESTGKIVATTQKGTVTIDYCTLTNTANSQMLQNTSGTFENLAAGNYVLYVFDTNGCRSQNPYPAAVNQPETLSIEIDAIHDVINKGAADGTISFRIKGGNTGNVQVYLVDNQNKKIDSLVALRNFAKEFSVSAGSYTLQAIDSKGCTFETALLQVAEPNESLQLIVTEVHDALCKSQTGSITVAAQGGWGGYRYKRAVDGQYTTLNRFENLYPGTYVVTVTDSRGATASQSITVYEPQDSLQAKITAVKNPTCANNGTLSIAVSGGTAPYKLFSDNENDAVSIAQAQTVQWKNAQSGALLLRLTDANGCRFELETVIPETSLLKIEQLKTVSPSEITNNGTISAEISGGTSPLGFVWKKIGSAAAFPHAASINNLSSGYYELTVTDGSGCSVSQSVYLPASNDSAMEIIETGNETSLNAANGYAVLFVDMSLSNIRIINPENKYVDYVPTTHNSNFRTSNDTIYLNNLESGGWFVIGTDTQGKNAVAEFEIQSYKTFIFSKIEIIPATTPNGTNGSASIQILGGAGENVFVWKDAQNNIIPANNDEFSTHLNNLPAGMYTVTVTDKYGNVISKEIEIPAPAQALHIVVLEQKNESCNGATDAYVVLSAVGGWGDYRFAHYRQPTSGLLNYSNSTVYSALETGAHYLYVVDKYGTTAELLITITEPNVLRSSVQHIENVKCKGDLNGKITFTITGGTAPYYFKKQGASVWTKGNVANNLAAGDYVFEFTDSLQCTCSDILQVTVTEPDSLLVENINITHTTCGEDNGQIAVVLKGGTRPYRYEWKDAENTVIGTDSTVNSLKQNTLYRLYITDNNNCTQYFEQLINGSVSPRITGIETTNILCYGNSTGTAQITDVENSVPYAPHTFAWWNGATGDFAENLPAGRHFVTVTDTNSCATTYYFDITQPDSLYIRISDYKEPHCFGYSDAYIHTETYGGVENYMYLWSNGETTPNIGNIPKGAYWVQVTDNNNCMFELPVTLNEPAYQSIDLGENVTMCPGNTHVIDGGNYTSYRWFSENNNTISTERYFSVTEARHYYLEAKTPDGCSAWGDISIEIGNNALQADLLVASEAEVGDTIYVFELSNLPVDRIEWKYDTAAFTRIDTDDVYNQSYVLLLESNQTGMYNIGLQAYSGGCYSPAVKQIEILAKSEDDSEEEWGIEPLITDLTIFPNPNDGNFIVEVTLRETADIDLKLFNVTSGTIVNHRNESGLDFYTLNYSLQGLNSGVYVLIVTAGTERKQVKIVVNR